jgi:response regulator RpfG family c-di-GMP phosphodiesterase
MLASILRFRMTVRESRVLLVKNRKRISALSASHLVLMVFFLVGYLVVAYATHHDIQSIGVLFVGAIFFFGAVFVFLGISLQSEMLSSILSHHDDLLTSNRQLRETESVTIFALAYQAELRDHETGAHIERTAQYVKLIAEWLAEMPELQSYLTPEYIFDLVKAAPLHDIGKVGIPDSILLKPGRLTPDEFEVIKKHCEYGAQVLEIADEKLTFQSFLKIAIQIVLAHHEKWDGTGYPKGLKGEEIPLSARIMALADVYDALRSCRCYKPCLPHEDAVKIILAARGQQFDPAVVDAFLGVEGQFEKVASDESG